MSKITKAQAKRAEMEAARAALLEFISPGDTIQCILRHVSKSGMMRHISLRAHDRDISYLAAMALDYKQADNGGLKVGGCGMDMGFAVVYNLGWALWPDGTDTPHGTRNGEPDSDGGYALKHQWI